MIASQLGEVKEAEFWMLWEDFVKVFNRLYIGKIEALAFPFYQLHGSFPKRGGCTDHVTFRNNAAVLLRTKSKAAVKVYAMVSQPDQRYTREVTSISV